MLQRWYYSSILKGKTEPILFLNGEKRLNLSSSEAGAALALQPLSRMM